MGLSMSNVGVNVILPSASVLIHKILLWHYL